MWIDVQEGLNNHKKRSTEYLQLHHRLSRWTASVEVLAGTGSLIGCVGL